jgi:hypothetical protein
MVPEQGAAHSEPSLPEQGMPDRTPAGPVQRSPRRSRRVTTDPPPGTDPNPASEPDRHELTENDARLKAEKPPHY